MKFLAFITWFAVFWLKAESVCEELAILSRRLDHRFYNQSLGGLPGGIVEFENEIFGNNILCMNISQSLELEIRNPTTYRKKSTLTNNYYYGAYWEYLPDQHNIIPCHDFTIVESRIPILPPSFLSSYPDVVSLNLRSIHIKTIKPGAFKELTKLERLHLDENEISVVTAILFFSIENLQKLTLSENRITTFDFDTASLLKSLNYLDLSGNPIKLIPDSDHSELSNLQTLLLNNTLIEGLNVSFAIEFELLNLSSSHLTDVDFSLYPKAKMLDLSYNQIASTSNIEYLLSGLVYLNHNNLSDFEFSCINNNITSFLNISNNALEIITACHSRTLKTLDVSFNSISTIQNDTFAEMSALLYLNLQNNLLTTVPVDSFRDLHALTHLDLSSNKIKQFQSGTFSSLTKLEYLNIQHNQLTSIFQLNSLVHLTELYADNNGIEFNVTDLLQYFRYLKLISFSHNPWSCQNLARTYHRLTDFQVVVAKGDSLDIENLHGIACSDSGKINSVDFSESVHSVETSPPKAASIDGTFDQFFNFNFYQSKFYKYFEEDYAKSNFFSYLRNYKFVIGNNVEANSSNNKSETARLTSLVVKPEMGGDGAGASAILNLMLLTIVVILLSCLLYVSYKKMMIMDTLRNNRESISMQERFIIA